MDLSRTARSAAAYGGLRSLTSPSTRTATLSKRSRPLSRPFQVNCFATAVARSRALNLQNIKPGVGIGDIHPRLRVDETIAGLDHLRPVRPRIEHALGRRRHEITDLARLEWIGDVIGAHAGIVQGGEDEARALERAGPVLPQIVRAEMAALFAIVELVRDRHGGDAHRV